MQGFYNGLTDRMHITLIMTRHIHLVYALPGRSLTSVAHVEILDFVRFPKRGIGETQPALRAVYAGLVGHFVMGIARAFPEILQSVFKREHGAAVLFHRKVFCARWDSV